MAELIQDYYGLETFFLRYYYFFAILIREGRNSGFQLYSVVTDCNFPTNQNI